MLDLEAARKVAEAAAQSAGEEIRRFIGRPLHTMEKSSPHDLVTEVDKNCQRIIEEQLLTAFPNSEILGEETVKPGSEAAIEAVAKADQTRLWVIDPIDGTLNFIRGIPFCSVAIGLVEQGKGVVGVIYDPVRDEMFSGTLGGPVTVNAIPVSVSEVADLSSAVLTSGFPSGKFRDKNAEQFLHFSRNVRNLRAMGSAALHLAYVAAGRVDGFWQFDLNAWDLLAGAVLVQGAGGMVSDLSGDTYTLATRHVAASNGKVHEQLLGDLRTL